MACCPRLRQDPVGTNRTPSRRSRDSGRPNDTGNGRNFHPVFVGGRRKDRNRDGCRHRALSHERDVVSITVLLGEDRAARKFVHNGRIVENCELARCQPVCARKGLDAPDERRLRVGFTCESTHSHAPGAEASRGVCAVASTSNMHARASRASGIDPRPQRKRPCQHRVSRDQHDLTPALAFTFASSPISPSLRMFHTCPPAGPNDASLAPTEQLQHSRCPTCRTHTSSATTSTEPDNT